MTRKKNEERLGINSGAPESNDAPAAIAAANPPDTTPVLSYVAPTHLIDLPSEGKYYPPNHPLHQVGEVEIKEMTAKEEDILTSKSLIQKGVVFDRLLHSLLLDKRVNIDDLLIGDKNALLVGARKAGYGVDYEVGISCTMCGRTTDHSFNLDECPVKSPIDFKEPSDDEDLGTSIVESEYPGIFDVTLPHSGVTVSIRLLTGRDEKKTTADESMRKKNKLPEANLTTHFKNIIVAANGDRNKIAIDKFAEAMPAKDSKFLRAALVKLTPNIEMRQEFVCPECDYEQDVEVPFTAQFFWPE